MPPSRPSKPRRSRQKLDDPFSETQPNWLSEPAFQSQSSPKREKARFLKPVSSKPGQETSESEKKPPKNQSKSKNSRSKSPRKSKSNHRKKNKKSWKAPSWFPWLAWGAAVVFLVMLALAIALDSIFSWRSNFIYLTHRQSTSPLEVRVDSKTWLPATDLDVPKMAKALKVLHQSEGVRVFQVRIRRQSSQSGAGFARFLTSSEMLVFQFRPEHFESMPVFRGGFAPSTAKDFVSKEGFTFAMNANFFDPSGFPLGQVIQNGKEFNPVFPSWSGYFFVKGGKTMIGPKSLLDETPGELEHAIQVYPSVMKNHQVFSYVNQTPDRFFDGKKITYRSLGGVKKDGTIVFLLSGKGGVCNVSELSSMARALEIQHATLFDAGRALQYYYKKGSRVISFHSFNNRIGLESLLGGRFNAVRSPVFLGIRPRQPKTLASHLQPSS